MTDEINQVKRMGNYEVKFKGGLNISEDDYLHLKISLSKDMIDLIKSVCVMDEKTEAYFNNGVERVTLERYKVKTPVYSALYNSYRDLLFLTELVDSGFYDLKFSDVEKVDKTMSGFRDMFKRLINVVLGYQDINISMKYDVN